MKEIVPPNPALKRLVEKKLQIIDSPELKSFMYLHNEIDDLKDAIIELQDIIRKNKLE